jgi:hypothetical protein
MTDYGGSRRERRALNWRVIAAAVVVLVVALAAGGWFWSRPVNIRQARLWAISGPPCPAVAAQVFAAYPIKPQMDFEFSGVTFTHAHGNADCQDIHDDGGEGLGTHPVCQFTAPTVLKVTTRKGDYYFIPGLGRATVTVQGDVPTCVRAAWFSGASNQ